MPTVPDACYPETTETILRPTLNGDAMSLHGRLTEVKPLGVGWPRSLAMGWRSRKRRRSRTSCRCAAPIDELSGPSEFDPNTDVAVPLTGSPVPERAFLLRLSRRTCWRIGLAQSLRCPNCSAVAYSDNTNSTRSSISRWPSLSTFPRVLPCLSFAINSLTVLCRPSCK